MEKLLASGVEKLGKYTGKMIAVGFWAGKKASGGISSGLKKVFLDSAISEIKEVSFEEIKNRLKIK
ncbi:hypothetical protein EII17_01915 [Clostridiales bacterium COT073_COT-073]|nr:hypothetical protein EII17_01915 [Clostridiales bacterium COT073_COT-073]